MNSQPEPKSQIHVRVWRVTDPETNFVHRLKWAWKVCYTSPEGVTDEMIGDSNFERAAKWRASRAIIFFRKENGIGRGEPLDLFYEVPEVPVSDKELARAAKRLREIEKDLGS